MVTWSSSLSMSRSVHLWQDAAVPLTLAMLRIQIWWEPHDCSASWGLCGCGSAGQIPDNHRRRREPGSRSGSAECALTERPLHTRVRVIDSVALVQSLSDYPWHAYLSPSWCRSHKQRSQIVPLKHSSSISCQVPSSPCVLHSCKTPTRHRSSSHLCKNKTQRWKLWPPRQRTGVRWW